MSVNEKLAVSVLEFQ